MPLTEESPELYRRRGDWYGFTCVAEDYQLTQVAFGWHSYYTHIRGEGGAWRRCRPEDPLPVEALAAGRCLVYDPEYRAWRARGVPLPRPLQGEPREAP